MRHLATTLFILAGIANLPPLLGVLGAERLELLYGMPFAGDDLVLLMRHRAVLFGILGAFIIFAAFQTRLRTAATVAGLSSMLSFMLLALPLDVHGEAVRRVFWVDAGASVLLIAGYLISVRNSRGAASTSLEQTHDK